MLVRGRLPKDGHCLYVVGNKYDQYVGKTGLARQAGNGFCRRMCEHADGLLERGGDRACRRYKLMRTDQFKNCFCIPALICKEGDCMSMFELTAISSLKPKANTAFLQDRALNPRVKKKTCTAAGTKGTTRRSRRLREIYVVG